MKLNHVDLTVTDVRAAADFLVTYFGLRPMGGNAGMTFLTDEHGFVLTLMKAGRNVTVAYPGMLHIGFFVESEEQVGEINRRLCEDGFAVADPERHRAYGFYVGLLAALPWNLALRPGEQPAPALRLPDQTGRFARCASHAGGWPTSCAGLTRWRGWPPAPEPSGFSTEPGAPHRRLVG